MNNTDNFDSIIFDVDGTLWDIRKIAALAWADVIKEETDWPVRFDDETLGALFGRTMDDIFFHFYPESSYEDYERLTKLIYTREHEYLVRYSPDLYEGAVETIKELSKHYKLYIVTNAQCGYVECVFATNPIRQYFNDWMCFGDTGAPKYVTIQKLIEKNNLKAPIYVGDTQGDADSCKKAGIPIVYASYGLGTVENPYATIGCPSELKKIFLKQEKIDTVVFDLDGTLLDTINDLRNSVNYCLTNHGFPERTLEEVTSFVGNGVAKLMERAINEPRGLKNDDTISEKINLAKQNDYYLDEFREHYSKHNLDTTKPYDGIIELLKELKAEGYKIGVVSNKLHTAVVSLCNHFFPGLIDVAVGENEAMGIKKKPAPDMIDNALRQINSRPCQSIYVGDSEVDIETAANSEMSLIMVEWGFRKKEDMEKLGAKTFVSEPEQIIEYLKIH